MKLTAIIPLMAAAAIAVQPPGWLPQVGGKRGSSSKYGECITQPQADTFINTFIAVRTRTGPDFAQTAESILTHDFTQRSTSIQMLRGDPPEGMNFDSRAAWVANLRTNPFTPASNVTTIETLVDCDKIGWFFEAAQVGNGRFPVKGAQLFYMVSTPDGVPKAKEAEVEFNSLAWALNTGFSCTYRNGTEV